VSEHVRLHGGRVWVEDNPAGSGARFIVEIPLGPSA
jgi:signal transduction histidine kinase